MARTVADCSPRRSPKCERYFGAQNPAKDQSHRRCVWGRRVPLGVAGRPQPRLCLHEDPRSRTFQVAGEPSSAPDELQLIVRLAVLTQMPDVPVVVLCEKGELRLHQLTRAVVPVKDDDGARTVDHLGQVGNDELHAMRNGLIILDGEPLVDKPRPRLQGEPFVVDIGRTVEIDVGASGSIESGRKKHIFFTRGEVYP